MSNTTYKAQYRVTGGVHPVYHKDLSHDMAIEIMPVPELLQVSMSQHLGAPAKPIVKKGDKILRGQPIGESAGFISAYVHAPTSGTVKTLNEARTVAGHLATAIEIESDGEDRWVETLSPVKDWQTTDPGQLLKIVADAGICGMGGAGFPTHVKLSPPPNKPIDTLIINGAECEPYLTADFRLMLEHTSELLEGAEIIHRILGAKTVYIAIEDNKPEAISALEKAIGGQSGNISIVILPTEYPHGAEKQQIFAVTGREVPSGGLPMDVGVVVQNVGTVIAVCNAVVLGHPLIERVTTVTGLPAVQPKNVMARIGTSYARLIEFCGGTNGSVTKVISGGPMMGLAQSSLDVTTTKTTSGLLLLPPGMVNLYKSMPCISCGRCVQGCPMNLMPCELSQMLEAEDYESAQAYNVLDCIECGCCAFQCPANRPLVQHMRQGKAYVMARIQMEKAKEAEKNKK